MLAVYFCASPDNIRRVYGGGAGEQIAALAPVYPHIIQSAAMFREHREGLRDTEVIFTTWGMPSLTPADLGLLPNLKAVFYAAGSVKGFAQPFLEAGVRVVSAWRANALPVAEFTLAHILLAGCGYFRNVREYRRPEREALKALGERADDLRARGGAEARAELGALERRRQALRQSLTEKAAQQRKVRLMLQKAREESKRRAGESEPPRRYWLLTAAPAGEEPPPEEPENTPDLPEEPSGDGGERPEKK